MDALLLSQWRPRSAFSTETAARQQLPRPQEPTDTRNRSLYQHPGRHFKRRCLMVVADPTHEYNHPATIPLSLDRYLTSIQRMPLIDYLCRIGFMGLMSLGCIMRVVLTGLWTRGRRASSLGRSRFAAIHPSLYQPETHSETGIRNPGRSPTSYTLYRTGTKYRSGHSRGVCKFST
jgi:hypothetical protein